MRFRSLAIAKFALVLIIAIQSLLLAFFMRPIQDDYFNLASIQSMGVFGFLEDTWLYHGGNMVQFFIHCILILPTTQGFVYWNLGLFFLLNEILVFLLVRRILVWIFPIPTSLLKIWVPLLAVVGFESLFVPGFVGTYGFSLATLAHLWPVLAFVTALLITNKFLGSGILAFILGLIAGNSNLAESVFACGSWVLILLAAKFREDFRMKSMIRIGGDFYALGVGTLIGTLGIVLAPGFSERANVQVGLPENAEDFIQRLLKSAISFTVDGLTHPMVWVLFFLGVFLGAKGLVPGLVVDKYKSCMLFAGTFLLWFSLVFGATFAYPSWHQSMGLVLLLLPASFCLGLLSSNLPIRKTIATLLSISSIVMLFSTGRSVYLGINRSIVWDNNFTVNRCLLVDNSDSELLGAEIRYPPFSLGIEDVETWEWMRENYADWVTNIPGNPNC